MSNIDIKTTIQFDEYSAIVTKVTEECFVDGVYSPAAYELSLRTSVLVAFAPDFDLSDCGDLNTLWEKVMSQDAEIILNQIYDTNCFKSLEVAINKNISHRLSCIESDPMSLTDIALSKIVGVISSKIENMNTDSLKDTITSLIEVYKQSNKEGFEGRLVDEMLKRGLLTKPVKKTTSQKTKNNNITMTTGNGK